MLFKFNFLLLKFCCVFRGRAGSSNGGGGGDPPGPDLVNNIHNIGKNNF